MPRRIRRHGPAPPIQQGLRENRRQFALLVLVNAFVGAMLGLERSVLPIVATEQFGVAARSAVLAFIAAFGLTKALTNFAAGRAADRYGRRAVLIAGWLVGLPVPLALLVAPTWHWVVAANALLGINQGLAWSATVIMKIDLAGPKQRGLATGLNEFAGYLAVALAALVSGFVAGSWGLRAGPAYLGLAIAAAGLFVSLFLVRDTLEFAALDRRELRQAAADPPHNLMTGSRSGRSTVFGLSQAGFINNLNDGVAWGLFPLLFTGAGVSLGGTSVLVAIYPAVWGVCQLWTGPLSDVWGRRPLIVSGMLLQAGALLSLTSWTGSAGWGLSLVTLGVGTALVYPALLAAAADSAPPEIRASAVGTYRLWRDLGYVGGALLGGTLADVIGIPGTINIVAGLTAVSGFVVYRRPRRSVSDAAPNRRAFPRIMETR